MAKKAWLRFLLPGVLILIVGVGLGVKYGMERAVAEDILAQFPDRGVPRMNISLNGVTLDEIKAGSKDTKYEGNDVTVYEGDRATLEAGGVRVKGRGNLTWLNEKKPYQIKFSSKVDLFGLGKAKKWVLLTNSTDASNLRTDIAFRLARMLGMKYAFNGEYVELYFDGEYEGLYYLTHAMEIGKSTVDLKDPMGILVELDNLYGREEDHYYESRNGEVLTVKEVVNAGSEKDIMKEFIQEFNALELAIEEKDYEKIIELVDVESFVQYFLLSEFTVNPDAYWTSFFFYKDGLMDKIHAGPGWDFDMALANRRWGNWMGEDFYSPSRSMVRKNEVMTMEQYEELGLMVEVEDGLDWYDVSLRLSHIIFDLMEITEFREEVARVYQEKMSGKVKDFIMDINERATRIKESSQKDSEKWGKGDYLTEVNSVVDWIRARYDYFESEYGEQVY